MNPIRSNIILANLDTPEGNCKGTVPHSPLVDVCWSHGVKNRVQRDPEYIQMSTFIIVYCQNGHFNWVTLYEVLKTKCF